MAQARPSDFDDTRSRRTRHVPIPNCRVWFAPSMRITGLFAALPLAALVTMVACSDNDSPAGPGSSGGPGAEDGGGGPIDPSEAGTGDGGPVTNTSVCSTTKPSANKDAGRVFKGTL